MNGGRFTAFTLLVAAVAACAARTSWAGAPPGKVLESPYVFMNEKAILRLVLPVNQAPCTIRTITFSGWGPTRKATLDAAEGRLEVAPITEGIHIVTLEGPAAAEYRFLAMAPPPQADIATVVATLPRTGRKLLTGEKYTVVAMGDGGSEAADYQAILGLLLKRATRNANLTFLDRSYYGRTVDAAVRRFKEDVLAAKPDLGLVMYGSADQLQFAPLDGYLEQCRYLAERLAQDCAADTVFLQPVPHIEVPVEPAARKPASHPPWFAFRAIGFAESLRPLAAELNACVADTFRAVWGRGGSTLEASVRGMWPVYPPGSDQQMRSLLETDGKGDTLHPNALGSLAMARAVLEAICGPKALLPLTVSGYSEWTADGLVSHLRVRNVSGVRRVGRVEAYPLLDAAISAPNPTPYNIASSESVELDVRWPKIKSGEDLLQHPANVYVAPGVPLIPVVDFYKDESRVYVASVPIEPAFAFVRERRVCEGDAATVRLRHGKAMEQRKVPIPPDSAVGRIPLIEKAVAKGDTIWAAAELAYVRYGVALRGEAEVDGKLGEWAGHAWVPVGELCQARVAKGPEDHRKGKEECYLKWAFKAGKRGLYLAFDATGQLDKDEFTLFFDPREPSLLGTAGRYYWLHGALATWGKLRVDLGETSPRSAAIEAVWASDGNRAAGEMLIPYELMEAKAWPASGDLGLSIWWSHTGADGAVTNLLWSEDGYPWSPRWFGVVRLAEKADAPMPCMVRIK